MSHLGRKVMSDPHGNICLCERVSSSSGCSTKGLKQAEIARQLGLTKSTVAYHAPVP